VPGVVVGAWVGEQGRDGAGCVLGEAGVERRSGFRWKRRAGGIGDADAGGRAADRAGFGWRRHRADEVTARSRVRVAGVADVPGQPFGVAVCCACRHGGRVGSGTEFPVIFGEAEIYLQVSEFLRTAAWRRSQVIREGAASTNLHSHLFS
jgi:hypothetical protein